MLSMMPVRRVIMSLWLYFSTRVTFSKGDRTRPEICQSILSVCIYNEIVCLSVSNEHFRRALCQLSIVRPQKAVADLKKVLQLDPNNKLAKTQLEATQRLIRKTEFEKVGTWRYISQQLVLEVRF